MRTSKCRVLLAVVLLAGCQSYEDDLDPHPEDSEAPLLDPSAGAVTLSGTLAVAWGDPPAGSNQAPRVRQRIVDGRGGAVELDLSRAGTAAPDLDRLVRGQEVEVDGTVRADGTLVVSAVRELDAPRQPVDTYLFTPKRWATLLCRFADSPGVTPETTQWFDTLMGNTAPGMDHYWRQLSRANISLSGSVVRGWYNLPRNRAAYFNANGSAKLDLLAGDCTAAADADVFFPDFIGINLMFNQNLDCCAWGGGMSLNLDGQFKGYSMTWMPPWGFRNQSVLAQEMGHGFGLPHSSCAYTGTYDSQWDPMSAGGTCSLLDPEYGCIGVHTIAYHKDRLGWIPSTRKWTPPGHGTYSILLDRHSMTPLTESYLMAQLPTSDTTFLTLESRQFGSVAQANYDRQIPAEGVLIHKVDTTLWDRTAQVIDPDNNGNCNDAGAVWTPGETFTHASGYTATVTQRADTAFLVNITVPARRLQVVKDGGTGGTVSSSPSGIYCGTDCAQDYTHGTQVTLTAASTARWRFSEWFNCPAPTGNRCRVTMWNARTVTASYEYIEPPGGQ